MRIVSALLLFALCLSGFPALACIGDTREAQAKRQKEYFVRYDANHDGQLSPEEYKAQFRNWGVRPENAGPDSEFAAADTDKSGFLTFDEWAALHPPESFATDSLC